MKKKLGWLHFSSGCPDRDCIACPRTYILLEGARPSSKLVMKFCPEEFERFMPERFHMKPGDKPIRFDPK